MSGPPFAPVLTQPLIELRGVERVYGQGDSEVRALDGADLTIEAGEFVAIMGASGSGKSTCLSILGCLDRPTAGEYFFCGVALTPLGSDQLARLRRQYFGFVFQSFQLLPRTTALENVELPLLYRQVPARERRTRALAALHSVGLAGRELHTPAQLSGGQQQRVAIARAVVDNPVLLLADEPTGNLDSVRRTEIMQLLCSLNRDRGITVVMVTHEVESAEYATRIVVFKDGRVAQDRRREI